MSTQIKFGTDGWRAIIADTFTNSNVAKVATAVAKWLNQNHSNPSVTIGYDCRFGGQMFAEVCAKIIAEKQIKVYLSPNFVSTPMISLATLHLGAQCGIMLTASHNPPSYNGFKLKAHFGGPATPQQIAAVEACLPNDTANNDADDAILIPTDLEPYLQSGLIQYYNFDALYLQAVQKGFNLNAINQANLQLAACAMFGAGQQIMRQLFPNALLHQCTYNPSFEGINPEPIAKNLSSFSQAIRQHTHPIDLGFATDGDADRLGLMDGEGNYIDAHHLILLLIHYLFHYKQQTGKVVVAFSVTEKVKKLCHAYNLPYQITPVGFKYIAQIMTTENVLVGGEESGGVAVKGHIPERDGVWMALLIIEMMAETKKTLQQLINEVYAIVGAFAYNRSDLHLTQNQKERILQQCQTAGFSNFGPYKVQKTETIDGYKYHLSDTMWTMIRASGTEPLLRIYAEAPTANEVEILLSTVQQQLLAI